MGWREEKLLEPCSVVQVLIHKGEAAELARRNKGEAACLRGEPKLERGSTVGTLRKLLIMHSRVILLLNANRSVIGASTGAAMFGATLICHGGAPVTALAQNLRV